MSGRALVVAHGPTSDRVPAALVDSGYQPVRADSETVVWARLGDLAGAAAGVGVGGGGDQTCRRPTVGPGSGVVAAAAVST